MTRRTKKLNPKKTIIETIVFAILCFFPMVKFGETSVPTVLFIIPFLLFRKPRIDRKNFRYVFLASSIIVPVYTLGLLANGVFSAKDLLFLLYPFLMFVVDFIFINTLDDDRAVKYLKVFIIVQLVFCLMQSTNFANSNTLFSGIYEYWQEANYQKYGIWELSMRNFGTVGSPIYVSIICYIFSKVIQRRTGSNVFILIAILVTFLSGARIPLLAILAIEFFDKLLNASVGVNKKFFFLATAIVLTIVAINTVPFINDFVNSYIIGNGDITTNYSLAYRKSMLDLMLENKTFLLIGGYGIDNFPDYVDSEYILRFLQFGILNFALILVQYVYLYYRARSVGEKMILNEVVIFVAICMLTANVLTNIYLMQYIILSLGLLGNRYNGKLATELVGKNDLRTEKAAYI